MQKTFLAMAAALMLGTVSIAPAQARDTECSNTLANYTLAVRHFEAEAEKARALAEKNPLYESDVDYYLSVLKDAQTCVRTLSPMISASR